MDTDEIIRELAKNVSTMGGQMAALNAALTGMLRARMTGRSAADEVAELLERVYSHQLAASTNPWTTEGFEEQRELILSALQPGEAGGKRGD